MSKKWLAVGVILAVAAGLAFALPRVSFSADENGADGQNQIGNSHADAGQNDDAAFGQAGGQGQQSVGAQGDGGALGQGGDAGTK